MIRDDGDFCDVELQVISVQASPPCAGLPSVVPCDPGSSLAGEQSVITVLEGRGGHPDSRPALVYLEGRGLSGIEVGLEDPLGLGGTAELLELSADGRHALVGIRVPVAPELPEGEVLDERLRVIRGCVTESIPMRIAGLPEVLIDRSDVADPVDVQLDSLIASSLEVHGPLVSGDDPCPVVQP
ncbi:MAG: hypothetical protein KJO07_10030, partial [Deltaproteobacteria bacterium]|nr:hypothetical protein [Deltaproteobacteria bacterium]